MTPDVAIVDVFARDGVQSMGETPGRYLLSTQEKVELILELDRAGVSEIEVAGFAHPRRIPSLADAEDVVLGIAKRPMKATTRALVPNLIGAQRAVAVGVRKLSCLVVVSETYQLLNANMSTAQNLVQVSGIARLAREQDVALMAGVGTSFVCPYEGVISEERLLSVLAPLLDLGISEIYLADSAGLAWPSLVRERCQAVMQRWPSVSLGLHLHTLAGLGMASAWVAYECGVRRFDASVAGIGGGIAMPVAADRMGNVATEDLVYLFESSGVSTGIDANLIARIGRDLKDRAGRGLAYVSDFGSLEQFLQFSRESLRARRAVSG